MYRYFAILLVCLVFSVFFTDVHADGSKLISDSLPESMVEIKKWYKKYQDKPKLLDAYMNGLGNGIMIGVRGKRAYVLPVNPDMLPEAAGTNGFGFGYQYGSSLHRELTGTEPGGN